MGCMTNTTSTDAFVLVGNGADGTLSTLRVSGAALEQVATSRVGKGCSAFAVDAGRDLVYCATKEPEPGIVTWSFDRASGELTEVARTAVPETTAYLELTRDGSVLLGASYHGGWGAAWLVSQGQVGAQMSRVEHANVHCVIADAAGEHAYFVALGDDLIAQCALDADGVMTPLDPPTVAAPQGSGPRHLVLSSDERSAYLMTEYSGEAIRFDRDAATGVLTRAEAVQAFDTGRGLQHSRMGADPAAEHLIWGADLHLAGDGAWLLTTERTESTLATVALDADGRLGEVVALTDTEKQPRGFNVTPDGRNAVVVGEKSGHASLYRLDDQGRAESVGRVETGDGSNWVRFL